MRRVLVAGVFAIVLGLAGCASHHYLVHARDGREFVSAEEPVFNKATQSWEFRDANGKQVSLNRMDVKEVETKSGTYKAPPAAAAAATTATTAPAASNVTITVRNETGNRQKVFLGFNGARWDGYGAADFAPKYCTFTKENPWICSFFLDDKAELAIPFGRGTKIMPVFALNNPPWGNCPTTMAEFTLADPGNRNQDSYDISLVNGHNFNVSITPSFGEIVQVRSATGNSANKGVYPLGCDGCSKSINPPDWGPNDGCPKHKYAATECKSNDQFNPSVECHVTQAAGASYRVLFSK